MMCLSPKANILADNDWHAVLSDFGLTVFGDATVATHSSNPHGSVRWMAPELLNPEIFDMERFIKTQARDETEFIMPGHAEEVVEWCWKHQPGERPEIMDVVQIMKTWDSIMTEY
ncbi:hypothetical protein C0991_004898 [Blastosporella zonata]|nr:hypothetical protein C0991_004898 [Blastosporella zonata]